ncbi:MAG: tyrosine--tRNA ligase [SAR202 cluster bacterium]|nr:tyrosine--tRNA ligase [SAR202 cluster bacterium]
MWNRPRLSFLEARGNNLLDQQTLDKVLRRGVTEIIVEEETVRLLQQGKPLRLKMGFDPSRADIHLGHVVGLRKLRQLQELGHKVILIVGDWTAQIGDPSGQSATRPMLTHEQVMANAQTYLDQFFKVVDKDRTQTVLQSEWFGKFTLATVIDLTRRFTVAQFLERDDFAKRYAAGRPIAITEFLYPLLQGYDSVAIRSDVEFGGTDQKFNLLVGRQLQEMMGQRPQQCFLMPMLVGLDGVQKMSKSLGNYVGVSDLPNEMYGKLMSIADSLITNYFDYLTDVSQNELEEMRRAIKDSSVNPMNLKKRLALDITAQFHGASEAGKAQDYFEQAFQRRELPQDIPSVGFRWQPAQKQYLFIPTDGDGKESLVGVEAGGQAALVDLLVAAGLVPSKAEAKRLVAQGAVEVDQRKVDSTNISIKDGLVIKVGRRKFARLTELDRK